MSRNSNKHLTFLRANYYPFQPTCQFQNGRWGMPSPIKGSQYKPVKSIEVQD